MSEQVADAAVVEPDVEEVAAEEVPERARLEEAAVDAADGAFDLGLARQGRLRDRAALVVFVPVQRGEAVLRLELAEEGCAGVRVIVIGGKDIK